MKKYNDKFYRINQRVAYRSAYEVVPYIIEKIEPRSVIDFGCGSGGWCKAFIDFGKKIDVKGLDGAWVEDDNLIIPTEIFTRVNLKDRIRVDRKYDMAISLEVAEHIEEEYADVFIDNICNAADIVLFSAAIPEWGGLTMLMSSGNHIG